MTDENMKYPNQKVILMEKRIRDIKMATMQREFDRKRHVQLFRGDYITSSTCIWQNLPKSYLLVASVILASRLVTCSIVPHIVIYRISIWVIGRTKIGIKTNPSTSSQGTQNSISFCGSLFWQSVLQPVVKVHIEVSYKWRCLSCG